MFKVHKLMPKKAASIINAGISLSGEIQTTKEETDGQKEVC